MHIGNNASSDEFSFACYSKPHYAFDWIFFSTATGRKFLRCCDVIHEQSYDVIRKRRMEIAQV